MKQKHARPKVAIPVIAVMIPGQVFWTILQKNPQPMANNPRVIHSPCSGVTCPQAFCAFSLSVSTIVLYPDMPLRGSRVPLDGGCPTDYTPWLICNPCFGTGFPISSLVKVSQGHFLYFCWDLGGIDHKPMPDATTRRWICRLGRGKSVCLVWFRG